MVDTRGPNKPAKANTPKGLLPFKVVGTTICDDTDTYCAEGEWALLNKEHAAHYLDLGFIRAELPEDFSGDTDGGGDGKAEDTASADQGKTKP